MGFNLNDLSEHYFKALERLNSDNLDKDTIETETTRIKALNSATREIVNIGRLQLEAIKVVNAGDLPTKQIPELLSVKGLIDK